MRASSKNNEEAGPNSAKKQGWTKETEGPVPTKSSMIPTRNYFAPLQTVGFVFVSTGADGAQQQPTPVPKAVGKPHSAIHRLTY
jgi:hypothetical protein